MKIYTSYFANIKNIPNTITPISISRTTPRWFNGYTFKELAPTSEILHTYKSTGNHNDLTSDFNKYLYDFLDVDDIVEQLEEFTTPSAPDICLVCYEAPTEFCHRHLVSQWLHSNGFECEELAI
jgi:uncharacterized protein (DUF488 family)